MKSTTERDRELKRLTCSINYDAKEVAAGIDQKVGALFVSIKPKILSWNVRGLNDCNKRLRIKSLLRMWKVDVVCFQETKMEVIDRRIVRSL